MYCQQCGSELQEGAKFCANCGASVNAGTAKPQDTVKQAAPSAAAPVKKKKTGLIIGVSVGGFVLAALAVLTVIGILHPSTVSKTAPAENVYKQGDPIKIMTKSYNEVSAGKDSPVIEKLEEYVGSDLELVFCPNPTYDESVADVMKSGDYPHVMLVSGPDSQFTEAARSDAFWDITKYLDMPIKYPNLAQMSEIVKQNTSVDGKIYGIYRSRELGRSGVSIRGDWLDNLGEPIPDTIDDFERVLERFTNDDPDGNGVDDTYGMVVTEYIEGPLNNLAVWMGAPNGWGVDVHGDLMPAFMSDEYMDAMDKMRSWYKKGYINVDMPKMKSDVWNQEFLDGRAGVIIDVADRAKRLDQNIEDRDPDAIVNVFGYVRKDDYAEPRTLATKGYDGMFVFPKATIKTEEDLEYILSVMDKLNDKEAVVLMDYGIEGRHYTVDDYNSVTKTDDLQLLNETNDINQLSTKIVEYPDAPHTTYSGYVAAMVNQVYWDNRLWVVPNPAEHLASKTYEQLGEELDELIYTKGIIPYITGTIDEYGYDEAMQNWEAAGGSKVIEEINAEYKKSK